MFIIFILLTSNFPSFLERVKIYPVYKSGEMSQIEYDAPISFRNNFSKLFEIKWNKKVANVKFEKGLAGNKVESINLTLFTRFALLFDEWANQNYKL